MSSALVRRYTALVTRLGTVRIVACLLLGLATTLVAAYESQLRFLRAAPSPRATTSLSAGEHTWGVTEWRAFGRRTIVVMPRPAYSHARPEGGELPRPEGFPRWVPFPAFGSPDAYTSEVRAFGFGWPMLAVRNELWTEFRAGVQARTLRGVWMEVPQSLSRRPYPTGLCCWPIWPGFAVNTAVFTAFWAGVLLGVPWRRRVRRRRGGRCAACGYDLRYVGGTCPECGSPAESWAR